MNIEHLPEDEWLALHYAKDHISASQVSSILNLNKYCNEYTLWAQKCGYYSWGQSNFLMKIGHLAEDPIADEYTEETGRKCFDPGAFSICRHPDYPWLFATLDRVAERHGGEKGCPEIKLSVLNAHWNAEERGPLQHKIQNQIQMQCSGHTWGALVARVGRGYSEFHNYESERNDAFFEAILPRLKDFRYRCMHNDDDRFENGLAPEAIEYFEQYSKIMAKLHPEDSGETIFLSDEQVECARQYTANNAEMRELDRQNKGHKFRIQREMQGATFGDCGDDQIIKWKTRVDGTKVMTIKVGGYYE